MKYRYDPEADVLMITLGKGRPDHGEQRDNVITHYDKTGKAVEIEVLNASETAADIVKTILSSRKVLVQ